MNLLSKNITNSKNASLFDGGISSRVWDDMEKASSVISLPFRESVYMAEIIWCKINNASENLFSATNTPIVKHIANIAESTTPNNKSKGFVKIMYKINNKIVVTAPIMMYLLCACPELSNLPVIITSKWFTLTDRNPEKKPLPIAMNKKNIWSKLIIHYYPIKLFKTVKIVKNRSQLLEKISIQDTKEWQSDLKKLLDVNKGIYETWIEDEELREFIGKANLSEAEGWVLLISSLDWMMVQGIQNIFNDVKIGMKPILNHWLLFYNELIMKENSFCL